MKKILLFAAAAALFAACTSDDLIVDQQKAQTLDDGAVVFDAYAPRGVTRGGLTGDITNSAIQQSLANNGGFGVFAYYTDNRDYDQLAIPNFMYNQAVTWNTTNSYWEYAPVKYWPNEYGDNAVSDDNDKISFFAYAPFVEVDEAGKYVADPAKLAAAETALAAAETALTNAESDLATKTGAYTTALVAALSATGKADEAAMIADPPSDSDPGYTEYNTYLTAKTNMNTAVSTLTAAEAAVSVAQANVNALSGTTGITGMTRNTASGDPIIKWVGSFKAAEAVDLCWAVCQQSDWQIVQTGEAQKIDLGKPWLNVQRPAKAEALASATQKLKFQFRHALAKMQINVDAFVDGYDNANALDANSRIWIRSVRLTGFTMKGALNLNNETPNKPYWMNYNGIGDLVADNDVTICDQRKDGKEGVAGAVATNEKVGGLNPNFIQTEGLVSAGAWTGKSGVTNTTDYLFDGGGIFYVIPTGDPMEIEIVYDVETISPNLATTLSDGTTPGSSIENRITKKIQFGSSENTLEPGKAYDIHLHLGMNSVKFDAEIVDWDKMASPDIDLPANMPSYAAKSTTGKLDIPGADTEFVFAVTGLKGGESVTADVSAITSAAAEVNSTSAFSGTGNNRANASGVVYVKVSGFSANTTIKDLDPQSITVTGALTTTPATSIAVTQKAEALGLVAPASGLQLKRKVLGATAWSSANTNCPTLVAYVAGTTTNNYIRVWRNGAELAYNASPSTAAQFGFAPATGTISLGAAAVAGDVIKVTIKAGDVPEETISFTYVAP